MSARLHARSNASPFVFIFVSSVMAPAGTMQDVQTAESAIRNLHDTEIHGRTLRIAPAESHVGDGADKKFGGGDSRGGGGGGGGHRGPQSTHEMNQQINGVRVSCASLPAPALGNHEEQLSCYLFSMHAYRSCLLS